MHPVKQMLTRFYDNAQTVCISSSPRSGSTWLAETLVTIGGFDWVDEPLRMTEELRASGFVARTYVSGNNEGIESAMEDVIRGRVGYLVMYPRIGRRLLLKFVRLNRMMRWTVERYGITAGILLVRHPCAVVSSQLAMGRRKNSAWARVEAPAPHIPDYLMDAVASVTRSRMSVERILAINWAVDNAIPLVHEPPASTIVTSYERLMINQATEMRALCSHCRVPFRSVDSGVPSRTASPDYDRAVQLEKWRNQLSGEAQDEVREVVTTVMPEFDTVCRPLDLGEW